MTVYLQPYGLQRENLRQAVWLASHTDYSSVMPEHPTTDHTAAVSNDRMAGTDMTGAAMRQARLSGFVLEGAKFRRG